LKIILTYTYFLSLTICRASRFPISLSSSRSKCRPSPRLSRRVSFLKRISGRDETERVIIFLLAGNLGIVIPSAICITTSTKITNDKCHYHRPTAAAPRTFFGHDLLRGRDSRCAVVMVGKQTREEYQMLVGWFCCISTIVIVN
jgi:hypothetical protein